ncbi:helix-turn-helix domain-containing protein [Seonamhaeicola algicola]|uniref:Helix-turn-helix domain-containing protein n=1 Tax=Seonamhaeicola algicola TaxID=1719036 RepID=A0A5C7ASD4_9FLAO|nr:helix-turn-helix transcriptional regulator [Seonamhaeicola algicola]TXE11590.1 helix-turn-helix domain-containing protein [Seonamhaeicola algicola]
MKHFKTIAAYCKGINISPPNYACFDIRSFEENMPTVHPKMPPFKHEFYSVAIKVEGTGIAISGHFSNFPDGATIFFNTPFQILSWNILLDWKGYYLMFSREFITQSKHLKNVLSEFPFLKIDNSVPFTIEQEHISKILAIYENIYEENQKQNPDSLLIIESLLLVLLNLVQRHFNKAMEEKDRVIEYQKADNILLSRFQSLIETNFQTTSSLNKKNHSPSFYAEKLAIHGNHLNAVTKKITGLTAKEFINMHIVNLAKSNLAQTRFSINEIAYNLHFNSPNNFSSFFKKHTGLTPINYRKKINL